MDRRRIMLVVAVVVAVLGASLVLVYAKGADSRAEARVATSMKTEPVLVATQEIQAGESADKAVEAGKLVVRDVPTGQVLDGATDDVASVAGQLALTTLYPGEQVIDQKFGSIDDPIDVSTLPVPKGMVGKAVVLDDTSRISGFTRPGSRVGMMVTGTFPPSEDPETRLMIDRVQILATGAATLTPAETTGDDAEAEGEADAAPLSQYVLALTPRDAARLDLAQTLGKISLVILPANSKLKIGDPITASSLFEG